MKKTQFIDLITTIKKTMVSFCSITLFVAMGVAAFLGIGWAGPGLAESIDLEQDINNFRDLEILTPYGFEESDLDRIRQLENVETVEGTYTYYGYFNMGTTKYQAKLCTVPKTINALFNMTGSLPTKANEIVLERQWAENHNLKVGDTITFLHDATAHPHALSLLLENEDKLEDVQAMIKVFEADGTKECGMQALMYDTFTISGLAESPDYISTFAETYGTSATLNTPVDCIAFIPPEAFDQRSFTGYNDIFVKGKRLEGNYLDQEFRDKNEAFKEEVDKVVKDISSKKNERIINIATNLNTKIEEAPTKVKEYRQEITRTKTEVEAYNRLISEGKKRISMAQELLTEARVEVTDRINEYRGKYNEMMALFPSIEEIRDKLTTVQGYGDKAIEYLKDLQKHPEKIDQTVSLVKVMLMMAQLYAPAETQEIIAEISSHVDEFALKIKNAVTDADFEALASKIPDLNHYLTLAIETKDRLVADGTAFVNKARNKVSEYTAQLNEQMKELNEGQSQIDIGTQQITEYEEQVKSAELLLEGDVLKQFKVAMSDIKDYSSAILTIENNPTNASSLTLIEILSRARFSLASLFLIVGALVCYSALSRIIYAHMKLIGTKKALGLSKGEITRSYLMYGASSALVGCVAGLLIGYFLIQPVVLLGIRKNYIFRDNLSHFSLIEFLIMFALEMVIILASTFLACRRLLREHPVSLLAGPTPPNGRQRFYERFKFWRKLSLFSKTMLNNVMTDKRRVLGTLIGIAGCTTMLVCGMGIRLNGDKSGDIQFNQLSKNDSLILFNAREEGTKESIQKVLDSKSIASASFAQYCDRIVLPGGRVNICFLYVSDDEKFSDYFILRNENGNLKEVTDGVRMCIGYSDTYKEVDSGDNIEFVDNTGQRFFIPYIGSFESYQSSIIAVMNADTYERYSKDTYRPNAFTLDLSTLSDSDKEALESELQNVPGFITLFDYKTAGMRSFNAIGSSTAILSYVAVGLAVIMAFLVLLNLLVMHVEEKKREMIVLMINGYSQKDARKYVYKDTIFLGVVGIIIGVILGQLAADWNLAVYSYLPAHFYRGINWIAIGFGAVVAGILTFIISKIAMRRINKFSLTEINKF